MKTGQGIWDKDNYNPYPVSHMADKSGYGTQEKEVNYINKIHHLF